MSHRTRLLLCAGLALLLAACDAPQQQQKEKPGMYPSGWGYQSGYYNAQRDQFVVSDLEVNGEVGHPLYVRNPTARCVDQSGNRRGWDGTPSIVSGRLPDGMSFGEHGEITGIPTERANFIVNLQMTMSCNGRSYAPLVQQVRFYIKGTGEVIK